YAESQEKQIKKDWLLFPINPKAAVYRTPDKKSIVLANGLLKRVFRLQPNLACTEFKNLATSEQLLRAIKPEARITINGKSYNIGGIYGQSENAYLKNEWIDTMKS